LAKFGITFSPLGRGNLVYLHDYKKIMNPNQIRIQAPKGLLEYCILHIVSRGEVTGAVLLEELTQTKVLPAEGLGYPLLQQLKAGDLLASRTEVSEAGLTKKIYTLTEEGKKALTVYADDWKSLQQSLAKITRKK